MSVPKRKQPQWDAPPTSSNGLRLYNTLTRQKELFTPEDGNTVKWYICGPTVYDASHMGHARSYISFDIVRRVMMEYFGYRILHVMNITDIDDKIILRARRNHLFNLYTEKNPSKEIVLADLEEAMVPFEKKVAKEEEPAKMEMYQKAFAKIKLLKAALSKAGSTTDDLKALLEGAKDPISEWQDKLHGAEVTDNKIFNELSAYWEADYLHDMKSLNVLPPDSLTRVSEYVPEIVAYVEQIVANGFAYEAQGSVYFDVKAFDANPKHDYAKCVPEAANDLGLIGEGEGELSSGVGKKNTQDFALWKTSKPGEPSWDSPWGMGRPGWHIECSAMASDVIPGKLDIHCGGMDLMFPHHDNEIAQAEAYYGCRQWVNYFLHTGHLEIEGRKMSKSLKNFITIKEALSQYTSRQIRLMFLSHSWGGKLDYSEKTMAVALHTEKLFNEFFLNVKTEITEHSRESKFGKSEHTLCQKILEAENAVHAALCDNIDTPQALRCMKKLVADVNAYLLDSTRTPSPALLTKAGRFVTNILKVFGVLPKNGPEIGFPTSGCGDVNVEELIMPIAKAVSDFRDEIRSEALNREPKDLVVLDICGRYRDDVLPEVGIRLEDRPNAKAIVKLVDKEELRRQKERELEIAQAKEAKRIAIKAAQEAAEAERREKAKIAPSNMFKSRTVAGGASEYSKYDGKGIPTHDGNGEELSKSKRKNLLKEYTKQEKLHQGFIAMSMN
eukprot:CFRG6802T1